VPDWTIRSMLAWMAQDFQGLGIATARLDGELILSHVLGLDRVRLYMEMDRPLDPAELAGIKALVVRRRKHEPMAYILGQREFYRRAFEVNPAVLIPRPDTETLIERALELLPTDRDLRALDLCTGTGAIAITLAAERERLRVDATDLSQEALAVAQRNAERHGVAPRVALTHGDLFDAVRVGERYDLVVSNPPYIPTADIADLAADIHEHEPHLALDGGADGLSVLRRLCDRTEAFLAPGGALLFEVGAGQAEQVSDWLRSRSALCDVRTHRDLGGVTRVLEAHAQPSDTKLP
jgi:release factor glutamine methyltransferase